MCIYNEAVICTNYSFIIYTQSQDDNVQITASLYIHKYCTCTSLQVIPNLHPQRCSQNKNEFVPVFDRPSQSICSVPSGAHLFAGACRPGPTCSRGRERRTGDLPYRGFHPGCNRRLDLRLIQWLPSSIRPTHQGTTHYNYTQGPDESG